MNEKIDYMTNQRAADWYARLHAPDIKAEERLAFQEWLEQNEDNKHAYQKILHTVRLVDSKMQQDPRLRALAEAALHDNESKQMSNGLSLWGFSTFNLRALSFALVIGLVSFSFAFKYSHHSAEIVDIAEYKNGEMHEQHFTLADGSVIHLDVATHLVVSLSNSERKLELRRGRAFFDVAHDSSRPFVVTASGTRVVALGTRFQVEVAQRQKVSVVLQEGSVAVTDAENQRKWREVLNPGQELVVDKVLQRQDKRYVDTHSVTSWSSRRLVFDETPLHEVLNEINRYATVKIVLGDETLSNLLVGGSFVAGGDSQEFVDTLMSALPLRSEYTGANEIVLFQQYKKTYK